MNQMPLRERYLSRRETMAAIRCGETKFHDLVGRGLLKTVKIGRTTLVPASEIEALIARLNPDKAA